MSQSYIPAEDTLALAWMQAFSNGITANPPLYMLTTADASAISASVTSFSTTLTITQNPAAKTKVTVANKDDARTAAEQICRQYAVTIKNNAGITDGDKIAIGVRPPNPTRDPINPPATSPLLNVIAATPGLQTLRFADTMTPDSGAKPFGATNMQLFVAIGTEVVGDPTDAQFYGAVTKNPVTVAFDAGDDGKLATYFARWASRKGEVGPWSSPVSMRIAA